MNKNIDIDKAISALINRAEKDIRADELLSNDAILKTDPLRLFLLQQASEKIIKAWFLKNLELLELLSLDVEKWIKINNEIVNNLSEIRDEEKEKLLIINNFQKSIFSGYKDTIKDAVGKINEKNFDGILMKLNHDPVKSYFLKLLKALSDFCKISLLIPDDIIFKNNRIKNIENTKDIFIRSIKFFNDITKQLNIDDTYEIIINLENRLENNLNLKINADDRLDNLNTFLQHKDKEPATIVDIFVIIARAIHIEMSKFLDIYTIISYFPLIAYLAKFENISRYSEISDEDSYSKISKDMKNAIVNIMDLHILVVKLIDNAKIILN